MNHTPRCSACAFVRGTPYGGLGPKRCQADQKKREVGDYFHISPQSGLPLAPQYDKPRPDWCPRLRGGAA